MKVIPLDKFGLVARLPSNLNDLLDRKQLNQLEQLLSRKFVKIVNKRGKLTLQVGNTVIADMTIKVDQKTKKFVVVID